MNSKQFAIKYAGLEADDVNCGPVRIVGYTKSSSFIDLVVEPLMPGKGWPIVQSSKDIELLCSNVKFGWYTQIDHITLKPLNVNVNPYPHKCRLCKQPARFVGHNMLCSNVKCKSKRIIKSIYKTTKPVEQTIDNDPPVMIIAGVKCYIKIWREGGCVICGRGARDGNSLAHTSCWAKVGGRGNEINTILLKMRQSFVNSMVR